MFKPYLKATIIAIAILGSASAILKLSGIIDRPWTHMMAPVWVLVGIWVVIFEVIGIACVSLE